MNAREVIESGRAVLGIEFGSTRIKAVLIDEAHTPIASGSHEWENRLENGYWTYSLEEIWGGLQDCYRDLLKDVKEKYDTVITKLAAMGFSAMMHGYMAFDEAGELLVPFRTWRNATTGAAAKELSALFDFNIPERWSISHLYQAVLNGEEHISKVNFFTTLAGYIHWKLCGEKVLSIGDASGMFPIDSAVMDYDAEKMAAFDRLIEAKKAQAAPNSPVAAINWKLAELLPKALNAGEVAGTLSAEGAALLDVSGHLQAGIPMCPPEGDAGTGMAATNSVQKRTGNVSAGTSVFAMIVLEDALKKMYPQIDMVTTPDGSPVAMVHANNCTSDLNAWVGLFKEFSDTFGMKIDMNDLYGTLYRKALEGDADCGGLLSYGFLSGENIMEVSEGRPLFVRTPESHFNLANFMRSHLYAALGALKVGMDILSREEQVAIDSMLGHGGLFKTEGVGQRVMAAAVGAPVSVMETAGEGGPWGQALLASYMIRREAGESLGDYLQNKVFAGSECKTIAPTAEDMEGFETYIERFKAGIGIEKAAVEAL